MNDDLLRELINNWSNYYWEYESGNSIRLGVEIEGNIEFSYLPSIDKYQVEIHAFAGDSDGDTKLIAIPQYSVGISTGKLIKDLIKIVLTPENVKFYQMRRSENKDLLKEKTKGFIRNNF